MKVTKIKKKLMLVLGCATIQCFAISTVDTVSSDQITSDFSSFEKYRSDNKQRLVDESMGSNQHVHFNRSTVELKVGDVFDLDLGEGNRKIDDSQIQWIGYQPYGYPTLISKKFSIEKSPSYKETNEHFAQLDIKNGKITANLPGEYEVYAKYKDQTFLARVYILDNAELETRLKARKVSAVTKEIADYIKSQTSDIYEQVKMVHDYICLSVSYSERNWTNPAYNSLIEGRAICVGYTEGTKLLLDELGIPNAVQRGTINNYGHRWNLVQIDGIWYNLDTTWDSLGGRVRYQYFLVEKEAFGTNRKVNENTIAKAEYQLNGNSTIGNNKYSQLQTSGQLKLQANEAIKALVDKKTIKTQAMDKYDFNEMLLNKKEFGKGNLDPFGIKVEDVIFEEPDPKVLEAEKQAEQERQAKAEAEKQAEQERQAKAEAEKQSEQERQAQAEAEKQAEQERQAKVEAEKQSEQERQAKAEAEKQSEQERQAKAEAEKQSEQERQAQAEAEKQAEQERQAKVEAEAEKQSEQERQAKVEAEKQAEQERQAKAEAERQVEQERQAKVEAERQAEQERQAQAEAEKQSEQERQAKAEAEKQAEQERQAKVEAEKQSEQERQAKVEAEKQSEQERQAKVEAEKQSEQERQAKAEAEKQAEQEHQAQAEAEKQSEQERQAKVEAEKEAKQTKVLVDNASTITITLSASEKATSNQIKKLDSKSLANVKDLNGKVADTYDIDLLDQEGRVTKLLGKATVTLPKRNGLVVEKVLYIHPTFGDSESLVFHQNENSVSFDVSHLSMYSVVYVNVSTNGEGINTVSTPSLVVPNTSPVENVTAAKPNMVETSEPVLNSNPAMLGADINAASTMLLSDANTRSGAKSKAKKRPLTTTGHRVTLIALFSVGLIGTILIYLTKFFRQKV
ncbi:transglutaminase domain-containing protein [Streptococcus hongkongensis]